MKNLVFIFIFSLVILNAEAVLITTGGNPSTGSGFITFEHDVIFTITSTGPIPAGRLFVIDEAISPLAQIHTTITAGLTYSVNGSGNYSIGTWYDNWPGGVNDISAGDSGLSATETGPLSFNDTVTLNAGTGFMTTVPNPVFQMLPSGNYDMFIADGNGTRISNIQSVPEPSVIALVGIFGGGLWLVRRNYPAI